MRLKHKLFNRFKYSKLAIFHPINFIMCLKYPFIKTYNHMSGKFMGYCVTEYNFIPLGWRKAFGKQFLKDIKTAGKLYRKTVHKHCKWKEMINWMQIKEKYGKLVLDADAVDEIEKVLEKYEYISQFYCIHCGKPTRYITKGWVSFICEDCKKNKKVDILSRKKDILTISQYSKEDDCFVKVDVEKEYNIDLKELTRYWND